MKMKVVPVIVKMFYFSHVDVSKLLNIQIGRLAAYFLYYIDVCALGLKHSALCIAYAGCIVKPNQHGGDTGSDARVRDVH